MTRYLTRELIAGADPSAGVETELTSDFDDATPGRYTVPNDVSRIIEMRVLYTVICDAADDVAMGAIRLKGAVDGPEPTIVVGAGGQSTAGTGQSEPVLLKSEAHKVDIPLRQGKNLEIYGVAEGASAAVSGVAVTFPLE